MAAGGTKVDREIARSAMASKAIERLPAVNKRQMRVITLSGF
jgi:hypothetical protein